MMSHDRCILLELFALHQDCIFWNLFVLFLFCTRQVPIIGTYYLLDTTADRILIPES